MSNNDNPSMFDVNIQLFLLKNKLLISVKHPNYNTRVVSVGLTLPSDMLLCLALPLSRPPSAEFNFRCFRYPGMMAAAREVAFMLIIWRRGILSCSAKSSSSSSDSASRATVGAN